MEITGKIIYALPEQTGVSKNGNSWKKREYVLETLEQYPRKVHFDFFGDRADQYPLNVNDVVTLSFDIESREFNNKWYTSIRGWKVVPAGQTPAAAPAAAPAPAPAAAPMAGAPATDPFAAPPAYDAPAPGSDDLPF